jgi:phosphoenolpyruvate carboxylase
VATKKKTTRHRRTSKNPRYWSAEVTKHSNALDLENSVFTWQNPRRIAASLKQSAEHSHRRKSEPYRSAMSMLTFYINRAGTGLSKHQRDVLEQAKDELRAQYGRPRRTAKKKTTT